MTYEEMTKDISLKNSIVLAKTLSAIFSDVTYYNKFVSELNKYVNNPSMQKYVWNRELDKQYRSLVGRDKELRSIALKSMCTSSSTLTLVGFGQTCKIISTEDIAYKRHTFERVKKHVYYSDEQEVEVKANEEHEIHKYDLAKLLLERKYFGVMLNAKMKANNVTFANGVDTPYDIISKIIFKKEA